MSLSSCSGPILLPQWAFALQRTKPPPNQCAVQPVRPSACTQDLPSWRSDGIGGGRLIQIGSSANGVLVSRWSAIGREAPMGEADTVSTIRLASTGVVPAFGDLGTVLERPGHGVGVPSCETPADQAIRERPADRADGEVPSWRRVPVSRLSTGFTGAHERGHMTAKPKDAPPAASCRCSRPGLGTLEGAGRFNT